MVGGGIYWLHGSLEIAIVVAVIPLHYFLRDALGQYYALRRDAEPAEKTGEPEANPEETGDRARGAGADEAKQ